MLLIPDSRDEPRMLDQARVMNVLPDPLLLQGMDHSSVNGLKSSLGVLYSFYHLLRLEESHRCRSVEHESNRATAELIGWIPPFRFRQRLITGERVEVLISLLRVWATSQVLP